MIRVVNTLPSRMHETGGPLQSKQTDATCLDIIYYSNMLFTIMGSGRIID